MAMKRFFVGVKAIIKDPTRGVLLLEDPRIIDVPGGRIDENETFKETLKREIDEELPGTEVISVGELLGTYRVPMDVADDTGLVLLFFRVEAVVPEEVILSSEHVGYLWVNSVENIPKDRINEEIRRIVTEILQ